MNENDTTHKSEINATMAFTQSLACIEKQKKNILARRLKEDFLYSLHRIRGILFYLLIEPSDLIISKTPHTVLTSANIGDTKTAHTL
jgi:hypothetical protein